MSAPRRQFERHCRSRDPLAVGSLLPALIGDPHRSAYHTSQQIHTMKKYSIRLLLACTIALVFSGCATSHHSCACDYKVIYGAHGIADLRLEVQIQKAAAEGWQVVSSGGGDEKPFVILCKPK